MSLMTEHVQNNHMRKYNCTIPAENPSKNYILAKEDYYFVYPNQFHEYKRQFQGGFQHGGVSIEEMIIPLITMTSKK